MKKNRKMVRQPEDSLEQYEAYGEYSYAYQHQEQNPKDEEPFPEPEYDEEEPVSPPRPRRKRSVLGRLVFLLVCLAVVLVVLQGTVFQLREVYVLGNQQRTKQQVVMASGLTKGQNIFTITEEQVRRNLSQDHTIEFLYMQKAFPSTLYLYIRERKPVAALQWLGILYTLDGDALVMEESNDLEKHTSKLMVTGFQVNNIQVGQKLEVKNPRQITAYQTVMSELSQQIYMDQIVQINLSDPDNMYLLTADGITVRVGSAEYMRAKIGATRTDMAYLRQLGKTSGILDVTIPEDAKYMPED